VGGLDLIHTTAVPKGLSDLIFVSLDMFNKNGTGEKIITSNSSSYMSSIHSIFLLGSGGRGTLAGERGMGESQFRRGDIH
jgi:hypothetical protein